MGENVTPPGNRFISPHVICFGDHDNNGIAASKRAAVLFDREPIQDPITHQTQEEGPRQSGESLQAYIRRIIKPHTPTPFALVPSQFLQRARELTPPKPEPSASAFSQWVYSIYGKRTGGKDDLRAGMEAEREIFLKRKSSAVGCADENFLKKTYSGWKLIYNGMSGGMHDFGYLSIPQLAINNEPLRASPDLIYQNENSSEIILVEVKFSHLPLTSNLWPNIWAQLWCYSHAPLAISAPTIRVVGEIWGTQWVTKTRETQMDSRVKNRIYKEREIVLRSSVQRNPRETRFHKFFQELFDIYRGLRK